MPDAHTPKNIKPFTTQLDTTLGRKIQSMASSAGVKNYVLINKMLMVGAKLVLDRHKNRFNNVSISFDDRDLDDLKKFLEEKGF